MNLRQLLNTALAQGSSRIVKMNPAINRHFDRVLEINIEHFLAREVLRDPDFFFVQIGANDGVLCDDIFDFVTRHRLKGIVIEPLPDIFERLKANYAAHPQVTPVNAAIDHESGTRTIYRVPSDFDGPDWSQGLASFDRNHILNLADKHPQLADAMYEQEVACISFAQLAADYEIGEIGFLQIDTEGFDFEIIKTIDFSRIRPRIIRYESALLSEEDNLACVELLLAQGYGLWDDGRLNVIAQRSE